MAYPQIVLISNPATISAAASDHSGQIFLFAICAIIICFLAGMARGD